MCERCTSHLAEYDHIALSLKKHGFYKEDNPYGWKLQFKTCPKSELDKREVAEEELQKRLYKYLYDNYKVELDIDDIGHSDKIVCIGINIVCED